MKLLLENWRNYLEEAKGDRETSAITREVILRLKKVIDTAANSGVATLEQYSIEYEVSGFEFNGYELVSILDIGKLKKQQQQTQKSQILSHIDKIILILEIEKSDSQNVKAAIAGGAWNPRNNILTIGPVKLGGRLEKNKKSLYGWIEDFNSTLNNLIRHELEHAYQDEKSDDNIKDLLKSYDYEKGNLDTPEKIKFVMSRWGQRLYNGIISIFRSKQKTSTDDYREVLNKYANELKQFRQITPDDFDDDNLILYYFQDIEIEAYATGFYREARLKASEWLKSNSEARGPGVGREVVKAYFEDVVSKYSSSLKAVASQAGPRANAIIKITDDWEAKVTEYAKKRFPILSDKEKIGR